MSLVQLEKVTRYVEALEGANATYVLLSLSVTNKASPKDITHVLAEGTAGKVVIYGGPVANRLKDLEKAGFVTRKGTGKKLQYGLTPDGHKLAEALKVLIEQLAK